MNRIRATYRVFAPANEVPAIARAIAVEQTVEVPDALIDEAIERDIVADVESVERTADGAASDVVLSFDESLACGHLSQFVNLVFGNVSLRPDTRLVDLDLPASFLAAFHGPNYGVDGLRALLGVSDRPLLATALKPRGREASEFAALARGFAEGGGDLVKDDHNLVDRDVAGFAERVRMCQDAVEEANARTGRTTLYVPHVMAPADRLDAYLDVVLEARVRGIMVAPSILGFDTVRAIAARTGLLVLAHPTFSGTQFAGAEHGIEKAIAHGTLLRLAGVDVSIFTNHGGRFRFTRDECLALADRLRAPLGSLAPAWPSPAGGMTLERVPELVADYGRDSVLLIGGALLTHGPDVAESTRAFLAQL